jgi:hypothetical protein
MPTRLIDVGFELSDTIRLYETRGEETIKYIALSYPWGKPPYFCIFMGNLGEYKQNIDFARLPATFQNAVIITRALGIRYLWINSIYII